jgi:hypothetical protein
MQGEPTDCERNDVAGIWRDAQRRRNDDLGAWLHHFFEKPKRPTSVDPEMVPATAQRHHADERGLLAKRICQHEVVL